jgi:hypothetical protein
MKVSHVFYAGGGGEYTSDGYHGYYGGRSSYGEYYPDDGRWTYRADSDYRWEPSGRGYGYSHSHGLYGPLG